MPPIPPPRAQGFTATTPVPLYWVEYGDPDAPPILLLHGGPAASHEYLLPQMLALAEEHRLVTYDQRGGGRSRYDDDRAVIGWRDQVEDVARVAAELRTSPLTIVGYSQGAALAEQMVQRWPQRYAKIVLIGAPTDPAAAHFAKAEAVVTMSCSRDVTVRMRDAAKRMNAAKVPATYMEMPGCTHGNIADGDRVFDEAFDWLEAKR